MVVQRHRDQRQRCSQLGYHLDIGARRLGLAAWMIVHQDHRLGMVLQGGVDHFPDADRRLVNLSR